MEWFNGALIIASECGKKIGFCRFLNSININLSILGAKKYPVIHLVMKHSLQVLPMRESIHRCKTTPMTDPEHFILRNWIYHILFMIVGNAAKSILMNFDVDQILILILGKLENINGAIFKSYN